MEGDEKLSQGAQTYTTYYGQQWEKANQSYQNAKTAEERAAAQAEMDNWHALAEDIRYKDSLGQVQGTTLPVPVYNQLNTAPNNSYNNLCWATSQAMVMSYYLGDNYDRILNIASYTHFFNPSETDWIYFPYNQARAWKSTHKYQKLVNSDISGIIQNQIVRPLSEQEITSLIDAGKPFGVLYGGYYYDDYQTPTWSGHWIVGIGYAAAPGHEMLIVSNDPWGGVQRIQTYDVFKGPYVADSKPFRPWSDTAF